MTDKKQIIIDGKGCRYKTWDAECSLTGDHYGDNMEPCKFIDEKSCYFKQLARKTQECEKMKYYLNKIRHEELSSLDIEWDEYITECACTDYSNIITYVEYGLGERDD